MPPGHPRSGRRLIRMPEHGEVMQGIRVAWRSNRLVVIGLVLMLSACSGDAVPDPSCPPRIVAAFDIGSGTTRMQVADVAECAPPETRILLRREAAIGFADDLARQGDGGFSAAIIEQSTRTMAELVDSARELGAHQWFGVATAAFRRSTNASRLVHDWERELGLKVAIISQREEGELAYRLIEANSDGAEPLVVWDIGAGSQQLVWRRPGDDVFEHFNSQLAAVSFRNLAVADLRRPPGVATPNPIQPQEAVQLFGLVHAQVRDEVPAALVDLIASGARVVGVGGVHGASLVGQAGRQPGDQLTRELLATTLERRLGLDDAGLDSPYADTEVTNLILVLEMMAIFGLQSYQATRADLSDALLVEAAARQGSPRPDPVRP